MAKVKLPAELEPVTSDGYIGDAEYIKLTDTDINNNQTRIRKLSDVVINLDAVVTNLDDKLGTTEDNPTVASLITEAVNTLRDTYGTAATTGDIPTAATGLYAETETIKRLISDPDNGLSKISAKIGTLSEGNSLVTLLAAILAQVNGKTTEDISDALGFTGDDTAAKSINAISTKLGTAATTGDTPAEATGLYKAICDAESDISDKIGELNNGKTLTTLLAAIDNKLGFDDTKGDTAKKTIQDVSTDLITKLGLTESNADKTVASLITEAVEALRGTNESKNLTDISGQVTELSSRLGNNITDSNTLYAFLNNIQTSLQGESSDKSLKDLSGEISTAINNIKGTDNKDISSIYSLLTTLGADANTNGSLANAVAGAVIAIKGYGTTPTLKNISDRIGSEITDENTLYKLLTNIQTSIQGEESPKNLENISNAITSLREHINTISPPTITKAEHNGPSTYDISNATDPDLTITIEINRPLESPLALYSETAISDTNKNGKISNDLNTTQRKWTQTWKPSKPQNSASGNAKISVKIAHINDDSMIYAKEDVSLTFGSHVYYWSDISETCTAIPSAAPEKLVTKNPSNVTIPVNNDGSYLYYAHPCSASTGETVGDTNFTSSFTGFSEPKIAGFDDEKAPWKILHNGIPYMIHRSNRAQDASYTIDLM